MRFPPCCGSRWIRANGCRPGPPLRDTVARERDRIMNRRLYFAALPVLGFTVWALAQTPGDPLIEGFRNVEVASVADAMEQLYGTKAYMSHDMRPIAKTKFAGPAVTVLLKKEEHKDGSKAS